MDPWEKGDLKRRLRKLKAFEVRLRGDRPLVFDEFFNLNGKNIKGRYTLETLIGMDGKAYGRVMDEYFSHLYYRYYEENGLSGPGLYDPALLERLSLPHDADSAMIKGRFRNLAMASHPDQGGDAQAFIALMETYRSLIEKGQ